MMMVLSGMGQSGFEIRDDSGERNYDGIHDLAQERPEALDRDMQTQGPPDAGILLMVGRVAWEGKSGRIVREEMQKGGYGRCSECAGDEIPLNHAHESLEAYLRVRGPYKLIKQDAGHGVMDIDANVAGERVFEKLLNDGGGKGLDEVEAYWLRHVEDEGWQVVVRSEVAA
eukprot:744890-Amorphochlora_amoeboformis.AAC.3